MLVHPDFYLGLVLGVWGALTFAFLFDFVTRSLLSWYFRREFRGEPPNLTGIDSPGEFRKMRFKEEDE